MKPQHLLQIATDLAGVNHRRPRQADLRRAISAAYYALFHCLAHTCADRLAGPDRAIGRRPMWRRVYRALDHNQAKTRCRNVPSSFPDGVRQFGRTFAELQSKRHLADYDPDYRIGKSEVTADIADVRMAIDRFLETPAKARRLFCIHVMMKGRAGA